MHEHADQRPDVEVDGDGGSRGFSPTLLGLIAVAIIAAVFIVQNSERVEVRFLFFSPRTRIWVAIAVAILLGVVLDRLFATWWRRRRQR